MNPEIDAYLLEGCGRCALGGTLECKVHNWQEELKYLRRVVLDCGLTEERKWGVPCYTHNGSNILMVAAFKDTCTLSFFKGALLEDDHKILEKPGENTQSGRVIRFTDVERIAALEPILKTYIFEAIEVEEAGLKVDFKKASEYKVPEEFKKRLDGDPELKAAFESLTPGRQKGYLLYFSSAKQSKTRESRIEKSISKIFKGRGHNEW